MRRILFYVLAVLVVILVAAFLGLGAFPPLPHPQAVEHVLPNNQFK